MSVLHWLGAEGLIRDVLGSLTAAGTGRLVLWRPWKAHRKAQDRIASLLEQQQASTSARQAPVPAGVTRPPAGGA